MKNNESRATAVQAARNRRAAAGRSFAKAAATELPSQANASANAWLRRWWARATACSISGWDGVREVASMDLTPGSGCVAEQIRHASADNNPSLGHNIVA